MFTDDNRKPRLTAVSGDEGLDNIQERLKAEIIRVIGKYNFAVDKDGGANPKMAMSLVRNLALDIEREYYSATREYVHTRLNEQIDRYIQLGFHHVAGYTKQSFRMALEPICERVQQFFLPPSPHPIIDGEFTLLLVLPPSWVPLRRLLASLSGDDLPVEADSLRIEVRPCGKAAPLEPYVLVGINGGRGLRDCSIAKADEWVIKNQCTHFSTHQLIQLFLLRPNFLSARTDTLLAQSEALVLGERSTHGLMRLVARKDRVDIAFDQEKDTHGGVGVGKPYYTTIIV